MAETLTYATSEIVDSGSEDLDLHSDESFDSHSYEEEDLCSSESEMATTVPSVQDDNRTTSHISSLELWLSDDEYTQSSLTEDDGLATPQLSKQELLRQIHLRRYIDGLRKNLKEKETKVDECRLQLSVCRERLNSLLSEQLDLQATSEREAGRTAAHGLLTSQLDKVTTELDSEKNIELNIQNELKKAELELCEAKTAVERFVEAEAQLTEGEEVTKEVKKRRTLNRLRTEQQLVIKAQRARKTKEKLLSETQRSVEAQTRALIEEVKGAQEKGRKFLQQTVGRLRKEEAAKEEKERARLDRRIKAVLSLKKSIESSQGTIQAQQMLQSHSAKKREAIEEQERKRVLVERGDPDEAIFRKRKIESFELSREAFVKKQNKRQVEIVNKLLEEEKALKKSEAKLSKSHWHNRLDGPHPSHKLLTNKRHREKQLPLTTTNEEYAPAIIDYNERTISEDVDSQPEPATPQQPPSPTEERKILEHDTSTLVEPEIRGLWDKSEKPTNAVKKNRSKMEEEMMQEAMNKLKKSNVTKQVVAGREFKGQAFSSKPAEVVFKDFDVGQTYRKKVVLTNISYSFNYCTLVGPSDNLKDFISIQFSPPGSMSAGLTCSMLVTFEPKLNEDIHGHIEMLSQTGPFVIPVSCLTKKCLVTLDRTVVDFGRVCVGETAKKTVVLTNNGALPTKFTFKPKYLDSPFLVVPPDSSDGELASSDPLSDKSNYSIMSNVEPRASRMETLTLGGGEETVSKSVGDLSCVSQKSLSWADKEGTASHETCKVEEGETTQLQDNSQSISEDTKSDRQSEGKCPPVLTVGEVREGEVPGFSCVTLELLYSPLLPTKHAREFIVTFDHPSLSAVLVTGRGIGGELPVWIERETMDLRVCVTDRLYQDTIVLHNRSATALRVTFAVPPSLQSHLEVLPKHGMVQGESSYSAQLKFTPRASIMEELTGEGGTLVMPVEVHVVDQTQPLLLSVSAIVTPSEITFNTHSLDFGPCTTHESVTAPLQLTNTSLLPQSFGFVGLPACIDVQPGDGFGEILPQETLTVDVVFSANKPRDYSFDLTVKTALDKTYKISCRGLGVLPALELSHNAINYSATALGSSNTVNLKVSNPKLSRLNSAVIRGALVPQGPKMFEFCVPPDCPISVCPRVGEVPLGGSVDVAVTFTPRLDPQCLAEEGLRLVREVLLKGVEKHAQLEREKAEKQEQQQPTKKKGKKGDAKPTQKTGALLSTSRNSLCNSQSKQSMSSQSVRSSTSGLEPPAEGTMMWCQAHQSLLKQFTDSCMQYSIPCFVSSETSTLHIPAHRIEDTLYLEVTAPSVQPALIVDTDLGCTTVDYDCVGTGDSKTKMIPITNISDHVLKLRGSVLDPHGPFELRNALRDLSPGQTMNLILKFSPLSGGKFCEPLVVTYSDSSTLRLTLLGTGVQPDLSLSPDTNSLDLGPAMVKDTVSGTLQLTNHSSLAIRYLLTLESSLPGAAKDRRKKGLPFRAANYSGEPPFVCPSTEGVIEGDGGCGELTIQFRPDHQSSAYSDTLYIDINGQRTYTISLSGSAWTNNMYILPPETPSASNDALDSRESMAATLSLPDDQTPPPTPLLLLFTHHLSSVQSGDSLKRPSGEGFKKGSSKTKPNTGSDVSEVKVSRELIIGCVKSSLVKKGSGDLSIDTLSSSQPHSKYFTINPLKLSVEAGTTKTVLITFSPPKDPSLNIVQATTNVTLKGDTSKVYKLLLRGLICE